MSVDRFDLEQAIMAAWTTADDLELAAELVLEDNLNGFSDDDLTNMLEGIKSVHQLRMQKLMHVFEDLVERAGFTTDAESLEADPWSPELTDEETAAIDYAAQVCMEDEDDEYAASQGIILRELLDRLGSARSRTSTR